jgi:hypothetical protein
VFYCIAVVVLPVSNKWNGAISIGGYDLGSIARVVCVCITKMIMRIDDDRELFVSLECDDEITMTADWLFLPAVV